MLGRTQRQLGKQGLYHQVSGRVSRRINRRGAKRLAEKTHIWSHFFFLKLYTLSLIYSRRRLEANGFDFFHLLPAGCHEPSTVAVEQAARLKRAAARKSDAKKYIEEERRKKVMEKKEREALKAKLADKKVKEQAEEEQTLYTRGHEARVRGYHKNSDQTLCIEMWRRLYLLFENRYDQMNENRDILAMAVACSNLGTVLFEFGDGQINFTREAMLRLRKADGYMDDTLRLYKNKAKMAALQMQKDRHMQLIRIAEEKRREKAKREQMAKGNKLLKKDDGGGGENPAMQKRKSKLLEIANMEARMAQKAADEAEEMEKQILAEFESSDSDAEEKKGEEEEDESSEFDEDEAEDDFDVNDIVARAAAGGNIQGEEGDVKGGKRRKSKMQKKQETQAKRKKSVANIFARRRTTMIPDNLVSKVPIPEDIALTAAIVKCNLVSMLVSFSQSRTVELRKCPLG